MIKPWQTISSRPAGDFRIFTVRSDRKISPRTQKPHEFFVLDCVNWVNVIAVTPDKHLVMVEQYRHGSDTVELEIPGGMMDPGDGSPVETAVRELREETGYEGENARVLGRILKSGNHEQRVLHSARRKLQVCVRGGIRSWRGPADQAGASPRNSGIG